MRADDRDDPRIPVRRLARGRRAVGVWLLVVAAMIAAMVLVGGLTRLTGSGLSITQWHPISGVIPPMSHRAWEAEFDNYKQIPQYTAREPGHDAAPSSRASSGGNGATACWAG